MKLPATIRFSRFAVPFITAKGGVRLEPNPSLFAGPLDHIQAKCAGGSALNRYRRHQFDHGTAVVGGTCRGAARDG
jgi:hypothetical protein